MRSPLARLDASAGESSCHAGPAINKGVTVRRSTFGRRLAAACVVTAVLVTGCSSSTSSSSSITSSSSTSNNNKTAVCSDLENLKTSIQGLKDVSITENGLSAISDQITKIKQQLQTLKNDANGQYTTEVNDLTNALNSLSTSFDAAKASPSVSALVTLASSAKTVITTGQNLINAVSSTC
jgi:hypothetical protein